MKNFKRYSKKVIIWSILIAGITSCSKDFLAEDPQSQVATSNYYSTEQDAVAAVNSIYGYLGAYDASRGNTAGVYHSTFWITQGLASDEMNNNQLGTPQYDQLDTFSYNADNAALLEIWQVHYKAIYLANIAIDRIPSIDLDEILKNRLVNEAKFLRGLLYFNLVRMFGDIPLVISEEAPLNPSASSSSEVYDQIVKDLTDAEALPQDGNITEGRATRGAAKSILSKVYLRMGNFQPAAEKAQEVIQSNIYSLWNNFSDTFKLSSRGGKEAIFSVGFGDANGAISFWEVGQFNVRLLPAALSSEVSGISNTQGWQVATPDLYNSFSDSDERKDGTFLTSFTKDDGSIVNFDKIYIDKYWDRVADPTAAGSVNDFPVIRYADVLLIYAEAQAELGNFSEADQYLNKVRNRANLPDIEPSNLNDFVDALLLDRRREFVAEGKRWFDLTRLGKLQEKVQEAKGITVQPQYSLFPIPQRERDVNPNLPQNPGF